ncbi:hypothetical protein S4054249_07690 [Pseudoalteromonas luteoviolacea]|uniref:Uncharacterized protein n=1 Tax=Pseudoalteromonas luteoviolacea S4054 TaxID=1129367 RepID=A0A0F6A6X5_9GAMM|nr:hypothetical protein S4054249_07690 [Pseudoalteromonas luteoviolacea]AOT12646.1 hypothetical protein S40542_07690 [Pseudoalteromonas luteoviolacea]AOT17560.1 hypothetical protein S4054_07690 [Pseudoalteromonas luteoviolacea]KKE81606.1 hypothetical protein N479_22170 [Pseudoalteromonas luteoviolacea S4054]KZN78858.1 hypothetical protein N481_00015 [Pseudoalteromonas luteoviolacea S4047-1]
MRSEIKFFNVFIEVIIVTSLLISITYLIDELSGFINLRKSLGLWGGIVFVFSPLITTPLAYIFWKHGISKRYKFYLIFTCIHASLGMFLLYALINSQV